jgi:uncharacterized protein with HEPN domain
MDRNDKAILRMLSHISRVLTFCEGKNYDDFCADAMLFDAVLMNVLQLGEQVRNLDDDFCARNNDIPWYDIQNVRHRIVHGYDDVDATVIWQIVTEDLPDLKRRLENA